MLILILATFLNLLIPSSTFWGVSVFLGRPKQNLILLTFSLFL